MNFIMMFCCLLIALLLLRLAIFFDDNGRSQSFSQKDFYRKISRFLKFAAAMYVILAVVWLFVKIVWSMWLAAVIVICVLALRLWFKIKEFDFSFLFRK